MQSSFRGKDSIIEYFYHWEKTTPEAIFLRQPKGNQWHSLSYKEVGIQARKLLSVLRQSGLQKGEHIGILSKNCYHWIITDIAITMGEYVSVPYYSSLPKFQLAEVIKLSDIKLLFVGKLDVWGDKTNAIPEDLKVIKFPHYTGNAEISVGKSWDTIMENAVPIEESPVPDPESIWTIKFTSGTTGTPKGVMHYHKTPVAIIENEREANWLGVFDIPEVRTLSFLPLNHVGERIGIFTSTLASGGMMSFVESIDTFANNIQDTQPTIFFAVPRIWNKFYLGVIGKISARKLKFLLKVPVVSGYLRNKIRTGLGMKDVHIAATGAAITPEFIKDFFKLLGIHLIEAYGMTEVCGSISNSPQLDAPADSVGKAVPLAEIKIHPETSEILMKTPYLMAGYYKDETKTNELVQDGWVYSGDRGTLDDQGYLRVIGRVKDAFKTAKGSYVTPNKMEEVLMESDLIEQVCIVGLGLPQPLALVNISDIGKNMNRKELEGCLLSAVNEMNKDLANFEKVSTLVVLKEEWTEKNRMLTPTLKIRRQEVHDRFHANYESWHEDKSKVILA